MANKTDIDNLVLNLERVCLEHYAMKSLLRDENPHSWRSGVLQFPRGTAKDSDLKSRVDELHALLLSSLVDTTLVEKLGMAFESTNLDDEPHWGDPQKGLNW